MASKSQLVTLIRTKYFFVCLFSIAKPLNQCQEIFYPLSKQITQNEIPIVDNLPKTPNRPGLTKTD
jgi:hypothetical protein